MGDRAGRRKEEKKKTKSGEFGCERGERWRMKRRRRRDGWFGGEGRVERVTKM